MANRSTTPNDIERLTDTVENFCAWIESLPARETRGRDWGPREVLSHLVYWHEHYVAESRSFLAGKPHTPPAGRFADMNASAVEKYQTFPVAMLGKRFRIANRRLCRLASGHNARSIAFSIKQGSKRWRLTDLIPAVEAHIRNHQRALRKNIPPPKKPNRRSSPKSFHKSPSTLITRWFP
jgi:hypothetical protein